MNRLSDSQRTAASRTGSIRRHHHDFTQRTKILHQFTDSLGSYTIIIRYQYQRSFIFHKVNPFLLLMFGTKVAKRNRSTKPPNAPFLPCSLFPSFINLLSL
ncbi:hypothetical protein EVA_14408 [gut metagenome]|uniref:Uncharacterized protein n=1 Tax=gut metagenome TaxID=749906 RepID=J9CC21_9ZZZZ